MKQLLSTLLLIIFVFFNSHKTVEAAFWDFLIKKNQSVIPPVQKTKLVSMLVEEQLLNNDILKPKIERYARDVQESVEGKVVLIPVPDKNVSPLDIFEGNAHLYFSGYNSDGLSQLVGTILIGEIPLPVVEKNGNLWPTIYPYVDLENSSYLWDKKTSRFVYQGGGDEEPEIWHGVIRSDIGEGEGYDQDDLLDLREAELSNYFDTNHTVRQGKETFAKKVFYMDIPRQRKGMNDEMKDRYQNYIKHIEDIVYLRFSKHWFTELLENSNLNEAIPWDLLSEDAQPKTPPDLTQDGTKIPDILSKYPIDNFLKRYFQAWENYLAQIGGMIEDAHRWDAEDIDTTMILISRKDQAAAQFLKDFNDDIEAELKKQLQNNNVSTDISVPDTTDASFSETQTQPYGRPLYWNGVLRSDMNVEDCSLLRGSPRTESRPYAQMVEANRTYDVRTAQKDFESPLCKNSTASRKEKDDDQYAGCCALNLEVDTSNFQYSYDTCDTGSQWIDGNTHRGAELPVFSAAGTTEVFIGDQGARGCSSLIDTFNEDPDIAQRFDSLMIHDEPRPETLTAQVESMATMNVPIDDPRGFSFYDHTKTFHRIDYPNIFDLRNQYMDASENTRKDLLKTFIEKQFTNDIIQKINEITQKGNEETEIRIAAEEVLEWPGVKCTPPTGYGCYDGVIPANENACRTYEKLLTEPDPFTTRIEWTESCTWTQLMPPLTISSDEKIVRFYETGKDIENYETGKDIEDTVFQKILNEYDIDRLIENIIWLDKPIEEKNREVFEKAFGPLGEAKEFFFDETFNGYELTEIIAQSAESDVVLGNGFQMLFEQGEITGKQAFASNQRQEKNFQFRTEETQTFLGENFEDTFLGRKRIQENCSRDNWLKYMACYIREIKEFLSQPIDILGKMDLNLVIVSPFDKKKKSSNISQNLSITPSDIHISSLEKTPIAVEVSVTSKSGMPLWMDSSSEVSLHFNSSDFEKFFDIQPSLTQKVIGGQTTFYLTPKSSDVSGKFTLWAKTKNTKSKEISVQVETRSLFAFADQTEISAGEVEGTKISLHLRKNGKEIVSDYDGESIIFTSPWGSFSNDGKAILENGRAEITFFPGIRAGKGIINFQDINKKLPPQTLHIDIVPAEATDIIFDTDSPYLIKTSKFSPIQVQIVDEFGNQINDPAQIFTWSGEKLETQESENFGEILIRPEPGLESKIVTLETESSIFPGKKFSKTFTLLEDGVLTTTVPSDTLQAGTKEPLKVLVRAETSNGESIQGNFEVEIVNSPGGIGTVPQIIQMHDGLGEFEIHAGTRAGMIHIKLIAPGFESDSFSLEILPSEAKKILLSSDKNTMNFDGNEHIELNIGVVDAFGNTIKNPQETDSPLFDTISLTINETKNLTSRDVDILRDLGVIGEVGSEQLYLENQSSTGLTTPENTILSIENGPSIDFWNGKKIVKLTPKLHPGNVFLSTETENKSLIPATLHLDVTKYFTIDDVRSLEPHSLVTFLLGFAGGDMREEQNVGNAYLFGGTTQSVGTLIADPEPKQRIGFLHHDGKTSPELTPEFRFGDFVDIEFEETGTKRLLGQLRILFPQTPIFTIAEEKKEHSGIFFIPQKNITSDLEIQEKTLLWEKQPMFSLNTQGGINLESGNMEFTALENSFLDWEISKGNQILGVLSFVPQSTQMQKTNDINTSSEVSGFLIESKAFDIRLESGFTGTSTRDQQGILFVNPSETESREKILGSSKPSAEDVEMGSENIGWTDTWKPGTLWAAGNSFGRATQWAGSDAFILLGDPTIVLPNSNPKGFLDITSDIGTQLWKSHDGPIDQIVSGDINGDGYKDIFVRTGNILHALYQDDTETDNFRDTGPILRFGDGIQALVEFDNDLDRFSDLLQVNDLSQTIVHKNTTGTYAREMIDLKLEKDIVEIQGANLNGDDYRDLVILDAENCLWKILGIENGFGVPKKVYCFPSSFETIQESYSVAKDQEKLSEYSLIDTFTYLDNFYLDYAGLENHINDFPQTVQRETCSPTNPKRKFLSLTSNSKLDATLELFLDQEEKESLTVTPQTPITARLTVFSDTKLENLELVIPPFLGMNLQEGSVVCEECERDIVEQKPNCEGEILLSGVDLPAQEKIIFKWIFEVGELPEIRYFVDDYFGKNSLDDIFIPFTQKESGIEKEYIVQFPAPEHELRLQTVPDVVVPTIDDFGGDLLAPLKEDSDGDQYPDMFALPEIAIGGCGGCGLPILNKVFLAPGSDTIYIPPMGLPGGFDPGLPILAFPTTLYTPAGAIPFLWPPVPTGKQFIEGPFNSFFRMYVAPTTNGSVGLAICLGSYPASMVSPVFSPTCFVMVPSILGALGLCPEIAFNSGVGGMNLKKDENEANYIPKIKTEITNKKIESADIVTRWIDKQYEALADITMPHVTIKTPDFSSQDELEKNLRSEGDIFDRLDNSPFINIKKEKIPIFYPSVTKEDIDRIKKDYEEWKKDLREKIKKYEDEDENEKEDGNEEEDKNKNEDKNKEIEQLELDIERNIVALESYYEAVVSLKEIPGKIRKEIETALENSDMISDYFSNWYKANEKAVEEWLKFRVTFKNILKTWESIPQIFQEFSINCPSCSVDRGTMHEWLLRILLSGVEFPIFEPPKLPNVNLDFSKLNIGMDIAIPEIVFKPVKLDIFSLPDISLPTLPPIPQLPIMPQISFDFTLPTISLPPLPTIPLPPNIPDILSPIEAILQIPKSFLNLTCLLVMGISPVPEWNLKPYIQQLTNRTILSALDFSGAALSLPTIEIAAEMELPEIEDINLVLEQNFSASIDPLKIVKKLSELSRDIVENISKAIKIPVPLFLEISQKESNLETISIPNPYAHLLPIDFTDMLKNTSSQEFDTTIVQNIPLQNNTTISSEKTLLSRVFDTFFPRKNYSFFSSIPNGIRNWLVSTIDVGRMPTEIPEGFDLDEFEAEQTKMQENPSIYYYDGKTESYTKVTGFPIPEKHAYWFADLRGNDQIEELLYSLNDELYLKYRTVPIMSQEEKKNLENRYEEIHRGEYEDRHSEILEWSWKEFSQTFVPVISALSETNIKGFSGNFERLWDDISYFEWVVSERPDHIFEIGEKYAEDKKSTLWERYGFLIRPESKKYEIRPMTSKVKKIKGNPILYASPLEEIPLVSPEDCERPNIPKPFFATESVLLGLKDNSRMEIRVPPRPNQEEEFREIVLHAGEETMVEYAEVCLTRGAVQRVSTQEITKIEPRKNIYLPSKARFELGLSDSVEIELLDGTIIPLYGGENYSVQYFEPDENSIDFLKYISMGNHYGFFQGFGREGESYIIPKFLHDPQPADDTIPPAISVVGGTNIIASIFQPVRIDASGTHDDQALKRVWWDTSPEIDSDADGDPTNDSDFEPEVENIRNLLTVRLPAYSQTGVFEVILNTEDNSGNISQETISITVSTPQISLSQASLREKNILGRIENGESGFPVHLLRKRDGSSEVLVQKEPTLTRSEGNFEFSSLRDSGGVEVYDSDETMVLEILPTGRPIRLDKRFGFVIQKATKDHPFRIVIHDQNGISVAYISFSYNGSNDVQILQENKSASSQSEGVWVRDISLEDVYEWKPLPYQKPFLNGGAALINTEQNETLGFLDSRGDFYLSEDNDTKIRFQIQETADESEPVIFEILDDQSVIGEFGVWMKKEIQSPFLQIPQGMR
jgi:hypothetical protein